MKRALTALVTALAAISMAVGAVNASPASAAPAVRGSSLSSGRMRPSITADFNATLSNLFGRVRWEWGRDPDAPAKPKAEKQGPSRGFPFFSRGNARPQKASRHEVFAAAKTKLAVIVTGGHAGTGFLVQEGGRTWLYTNAHVVRNQPYVKATMLDGTTLKLGAREYAAERDLARFALAAKLPALELRQGLPDVGEHITVLGNSDGRGVITELKGRVVGVGPSEIEIDATFTAGNSGSPVIDAKGRVVAVATYLRNCRNDADWSKRNTRFNGIRRFALRLQGVQWEKP